MMNVFDVLNTAGGKNYKLENRSIETFQSEKQRKMKKY